MATFSEIYFNGSEYTQMWFNGSKIWEKDNGGFPYSVDSVITYKYNNPMAPTMTVTFNIIDDTLPYYLNGMAINTKVYLGMSSGESTVKLVNLRPSNTGSNHHMKDIAQLRIPKVTDLSYLFSYFCYDSGSTYTWSPQYFEFNENPTNMESMFYCCYYLTDELMNQFIPYFPNTSSVTNMSYMFYGCSSLTSLDLSSFDTSKVTYMNCMFDNCSKLTSLNLSSFDTSSVTDMRYMFRRCSSLASLDLSSWDTSKVTNTNDMFDGVKNCTIYISDKWTLGTSSTLGNGSGLKFVRINPITSITLESTLTDTTITKGTQFTITPTVIPSNHTDELVITYDTNALLMTDNVFTVLDGANIGALDITYSSKLNPSISATYTITIRDYINIASITLEHTLETLVIEPNTTFTITPITTPTLHDDELLVEFDDTYITHNDGMFTITNAPFNESMSITYYSKANPSVNATLDLAVRDVIPITSITLEHTLETLVDVMVGTTFTVTPIIIPTIYDGLLVDYDTNYLSKDGNTFTVLSGASGQTVQIIYYSEYNNSVNAILEFNVESVTVYPYDDADSVITYRNGYSKADTETFTVIDSTLPYSIDGVETTSKTFSSGVLTKVKLVNLKPLGHTTIANTGLGTGFYHTSLEQLRIPTITDLSYLFSYFGYSSTYLGTWQPQYFELSNNATNMAYMFYYCRYLTDELMNQFMPYFPNTSSVTNMSYMFGYCNSLTSLDLSSFDTGKVNNMDDMFDECSSLTSLNLSNFNTEKVTTMNRMFSNCSSLTSLDLSSFDTSKVTNMSYMFSNCSSLTSLDLSSWDISHLTSMSGMFNNCTSLTSLDLSSFDTSSVSSYNYMFNGVSNCTIYIDSDKWTLGTDSTFGGGTNLTFVPKVIPITSIDNLITDLEDITNVTTPTFTITPIITPTNYCSDLEVIYDSTYLSNNNFSFLLKDGSQGQTLSITYRSRTDNSISNTLTFTVAEDAELIEPLIDFTQSTAPTLPTWFVEETKGSRYFKHGTYKDNSSLYGLVEDSYSSNATKIHWNCYKVVAPMTGTLEITFRAYTYSSSYPFTIHATTNSTQPSYSSSTDRLISVYGSTYRGTDGVATLNVVQGETYYIHFQHRRYGSSYTCACIRKIEIV
jgi:surface protein